MLADKAYPDLEDKARERLALNAYLSLLENPQVAFGVKQKTPQTFDAAVSATLELESYLSPKMAVASVETAPGEERQSSINAVSHGSNDRLAVMFEKLVERFAKLETAYLQKEGNRPYGRTGVLTHNQAREGTVRQGAKRLISATTARTHLLELWQAWTYYCKAVPLPCSATGELDTPCTRSPVQEGRDIVTQFPYNFFSYTYRRLQC